MDRTIALILSLVYYSLLAMCSAAIFGEPALAQHLGMEPDLLSIGAFIVILPATLAYYLLFKPVIIAPVLRQWAATENLTLGQITRISHSRVPAAIDLSFWKKNQFSAFYKAELLANLQPPGLAYFRLMIIAPLGIALVRAVSRTDG
jgi:hypothetical protein